ncbi:MAG TPA: hypothetical protein VNZ86_08285 [Bacteroidia bacterium]|jgi:hypothetical protein|nr:hypothetical protein [Bacteroidia bacterium]
MHFRFIHSCFLFLLYATALAQPGKESWHWQFGFHNALDFSSGNPVSSSSPLYTESGSASMSDPVTGAMLFYTDGDTVWNRNNIPMPNGTGLLGGNGGATQAALIIPKPGSTTVYYLITSDYGNYTGTQGIHYSVVDMSLNSGLGDISVKNNLLTSPPATEKLTAVRHCNGTDYWIITRPDNSNAFHAYLLSASGINPVPVVSNAGTVQQTSANGGVGYLKASPNGHKLAYAIEYVSVFELVDFDNGTGVVSNPVSITYPGTIGNNGTHLPYGIAFSPDNSKVYVSDFKGFIFQYDLSSANPALILASQATINTGLYGLGAIQLAPDGKIYLTVYAQHFLSVINNPNNTLCNFQQHGVFLAAADSGGFGLPNFIDLHTPPPLYTSFDTPLCTFASDTLHGGSGGIH